MSEGTVNLFTATDTTEATMSAENTPGENRPENPEEKKPQIIADDDWKSRVKAEDAALDEKLKAQQQSSDSAAEKDETKGEAKTADKAASEPAGEQRQPLQMPPASFATLVGMFSTQAMVSLGVIPNPVSGESEPQPELARHFIDLLGVVEEKSRGNLEPEEEKMLTSTLHELRMAFLQMSSGETGGGSDESKE